jgi:hypothetical protein
MRGKAQKHKLKMINKKKIHTQTNVDELKTRFGKNGGKNTGEYASIRDENKN